MTAAFRAMGPTAVPFLCKMLRDDSWWEEFYRNQYSKHAARLPRWLAGRLPTPMPADFRQTGAAVLLQFIGPPANAAAVPDLIEAYKNACAKQYNFRRSTVTDWASPSLAGKMQGGTRPMGFFEQADVFRFWMIEDLCSIGGTNQEIIPVLIAASREPIDYVRSAVIYSISRGNLAPAARASTGVLVRALDDPEAGVRQSAAHLLGLIIAENSDLISPLIKCLGDTNREARGEAFFSLAKASPNQSVPQLINALDSTNALIRGCAARVLGGIERAAIAALPKLAELVREETEPEIKVRRSAAEALWTIGHQPRALIPFRIPELKDKSEGMRWDSALFFEKCGPQAASAAPALAELLLKDENNRLRGKAAIALGQIGPGAKAAIPALKQALQDEYKNVRDAAGDALKQIDPAGAGQ
jgi:HEAT repeat protein